MNDPEYFRQKARQCRRLADMITSESARASLLALAEEFESQAAAQAAPQPTEREAEEDG